MGRAVWSIECESVTLCAMKIKNVSGAKSTGPTKGAKRPSSADGAAFSDQVRAAQGGADEAPSVTSTAGAGPIAGVDSILAVQDVGDATEDPARRQARLYGDQVLDQLDAIRNGLLMGYVPKERLTDLAQSMRQRRLATADPELLALIDEIELRAEVEIAKLSRRADPVDE